MKTRLLALIMFSIAANIFCQPAKFSYPIIFLHGLVSNDATWTDAVNALGGSAKIFDVCLNHDGNNLTASLTSDIFVIGWRDGNNTPSSSRLYVINFDHTRFLTTGHSNHNLSNQAAIYKQGIALKEMIKSVLAIENSKKVILIGYSMGGLEIREYLQRGFDGSVNGRGTNWVDQTEPDGHRVIRVVTLGTPHLGSNHTGSALSQLLSGVNESSEACRDLRYPNPPTTPVTPFLFGGSESSFFWNPQPFNKDVDCNGSENNSITGLNIGTNFNSTMPLPSNIRYSWVTSNYLASGQDGLVELARQWLYSGTTISPSSADTLLLHVHHLDEPKNILAIIRGIDEPEDVNLAYEIPINYHIKGYITYRMNWSSFDKDLFKVIPDKGGTMEVTVTCNNSGADSLFIYDGSTLLSKRNLGNGTFVLSAKDVMANKTYNIVVTGNATSTSWQNPYSIKFSTLSVGTEVGEKYNNFGIADFRLYQNFPNPFNSVTKIEFEIPESVFSNLSIYDVFGEKVRTIVDNFLPSGIHLKNFDACGLSSGLYFYKLSAGKHVKVKKMCLIK